MAEKGLRALQRAIMSHQVLGGGGGGGGGGGNLNVILVRVCGPVFLNLPQSYTWPSKNDLFVYLIEQNVYIFVYCSLIFIYPLCCL